MHVIQNWLFQKWQWNRKSPNYEHLSWNKLVPSIKQSNCLAWKTNCFCQCVGVGPLIGYAVYVLALLPGGNDSVFELGKNWVHFLHISLLTFTLKGQHKGLCGGSDFQQAGYRTCFQVLLFSHELWSPLLYENTMIHMVDKTNFVVGSLYPKKACPVAVK